MIDKARVFDSILDLIVAKSKDMLPIESYADISIYKLYTKIKDFV
jgi:hypothetical protein